MLIIMIIGYFLSTEPLGQNMLVSKLKHAQGSIKEQHFRDAFAGYRYHLTPVTIVFRLMEALTFHQCEPCFSSADTNRLGEFGAKTAVGVSDVPDRACESQQLQELRNSGNLTTECIQRAECLRHTLITVLD